MCMADDCKLKLTYCSFFILSRVSQSVFKPINLRSQVLQFWLFPTVFAKIF